MTTRATYIIEAHPDSTVFEDLEIESRDDGARIIRQGQDTVFLDCEDIVQELIRVLQLPVEV